MTITDLYDICDQMNIYTKCFVISPENVVIAWGTLYGDIPVELAKLQIEHFKFVVDDEVLIWVQ